MVSKTHLIHFHSEENGGHGDLLSVWNGQSH